MHLERNKKKKEISSFINIGKIIKKIRYCLENHNYHN